MLGGKPLNERRFHLGQLSCPDLHEVRNFSAEFADDEPDIV